MVLVNIATAHTSLLGCEWADAILGAGRRADSEQLAQQQGER